MKLERFAEIIHDYVGKAFTPVVARLKALEAKVAELEARPTASLADSDKGGWQGGVQYQRGATVTYDGSLFLALADNSDRPASSQAWRLIVRKGRDA